MLNDTNHRPVTGAPLEMEVADPLEVEDTCWVFPENGTNPQSRCRMLCTSTPLVGFQRLPLYRDTHTAHPSLTLLMFDYTMIDLEHLMTSP